MPAVAQTLGWVWVGGGCPDVSCSASALRELSEKKSFMDKESQITVARARGLKQPASPQGQRQGSKPSPLRVKSRACSVVTVGICLVAVSCPTCENHPQSSYLNPAP